MRLRLCLALALCGTQGLMVAMIAIVCSSWTCVNRATSGRNILLPGGLTYHSSVRTANKMVARTGISKKNAKLKKHSECENSKEFCFNSFVVSVVLLFTSNPDNRACLLILLLTTLQATWVVENPAGSCIFEYPRMKHIFQIFKKLGVSASYLIYYDFLL